MKMDVDDSCGIKIKEEAKECLSPTSTTHAPCVTGAINAPTTTTTIISYTPTSKLTPTTNNNLEPSPVNLNLKPRIKGSIQTSKDRQPAELEGPPSTTEVQATSPTPVSQRNSTQSSNISTQMGKIQSTAVHEVCRTGGSRSSDNESPLPQAAKLENDDQSIAGRILTVNVIQEDTSPGIGPSSNSNNRVPHAKLKRLLGTLVQFANDISPETGDTVRTLVLSLLSGAMTAEEFHGALQEATNFPLRGFVLPYLKHTLPSLQRDLTNTARANNQTSVQYLRSNESAVLEAAGFSPGEAAEVFGERNNPGGSSGPGTTGCIFPSYNIAATGSTNSNNSTNTGTASNNVSAGNNTSGIHGANQHPNSTGIHHYPGPPPPPPSHSLKRRSSDTPYYESSSGPLFDDGPLYGKRSMNPWATHHPLHHQRQQQQQQQQQQQEAYSWYHPLHLQGGGQAPFQNHPQPSMPPSLVQINHSSAPHLVHQQASWNLNNSQGTAVLQNGSCSSASAALDDEWKNIHVMLNCILGMVEKTKRALAILQRRGCPSPAIPVTTVTTSGTNSQNNGPTIGSGSQSDSQANERDNSLKRISGEIVAQTIRATEDRVAEVQRRAEEAMLEAKRAAVAEVQRAIAAAAAESRAAERLRVHHRFFEAPIQRSHGHSIGHGLGHGPLLRVVDTTTCSPTTATTTATTTTASNVLGGRDEEKEPAQTAVSGSSCWNCGRQALETCGGCGIARYCGPFCQHRDWEAGGHHATCNPRRPTPPPPSPVPPPPPPQRSASRSPTASFVAGTTGSATPAGSSSTNTSSSSGHNSKAK